MIGSFSAGKNHSFTAGIPRLANFSQSIETRPVPTHSTNRFLDASNAASCGWTKRPGLPFLGLDADGRLRGQAADDFFRQAVSSSVCSPK
ncbi:MAG: hypothetical protein U0798_11975 [Gemmataceae bacterium]